MAVLVRVIKEAKTSAVSVHHLAEEVAHRNVREDCFFHEFPPSRLAVKDSVNCWDW